MVALLSDNAVWLFVTVISAVAIATFTCSGLSSNPASSRSTRGRGIIDRVVVGDSALPIVPHPAVRTRMNCNRKCGDRLAHVFLSFQRCATVQRGAIIPHIAPRGGR